MSDVPRTPIATPETQPYWDGCARGELRVPRCASCGLLHFFPRSLCPHCWSDALVWERMSGLGRVASFVRPARRPPGFDLAPPFIIALIELDEGPMLMADVVGDGSSSAEVGTRVLATFDTVRDAMTIPRFILVGGST